jgi:hypothetical protein
MANMSGEFPGIKFKKIVGYRISACFTPRTGVDSLFFVYVWDQIEAASAFTDTVDAGKDDAPKVGTLNLKDDSRVYSFTNINLESAQEGVTRRNRYRLLEFRFNSQYTTEGDMPVSLDNSDTDRLTPTGLKEDYTYSLGGGSEQLLGFRARRAPGVGNVYRFSSLRNNINSFLQQLVKSNNETSQSKRMSDFTVNFKQGDVVVKQDELARFYVEESYGFLEHVNLPPLSDYVSGQITPENNTRMRITDYTQADLLNLDAHMSPTEVALRPRTVETATFVFNPGAHQDAHFS